MVGYVHGRGHGDEDVVHAEQRTVVGLIDKGNPDGLSRVFLERNAVLVPFAVEGFGGTCALGRTLPDGRGGEVGCGVAALGGDEHLEAIEGLRVVGFRFPREFAALARQGDGLGNHPGVGRSRGGKLRGAGSVGIGGNVGVLHEEEPARALLVADALHEGRGRIARQFVGGQVAFALLQRLEVAGEEGEVVGLCREGGSAEEEGEKMEFEFHISSGKSRTGERV